MDAEEPRAECGGVDQAGTGEQRVLEQAQDGGAVDAQASVEIGGLLRM
ncbi:hypothetical protein [Streptosporangium nondiastaticum]|nr:hypothetical protein [Streptosporangium nondiastaticum]